MAAEDRDRLFEKALARHLRDEARPSDFACLDAEMLSAYQEGQLTEEEMSAAKKHLGSCPRCREIAAQLTATGVVSEIQKSENELPIEGLALQRSKDRSNLAHVSGKKKWLLRWAAPVGAIAAGALLYVGIRDFRLQSRRAEPRTQIAENREDNNAPARNPYIAPAPPQSSLKQKDKEFADKLVKRQAAKPMPDDSQNDVEEFRTKRKSREGSRDEKKLGEPLIRSGAVAPGPVVGGQISKTDQERDLAKSESFDSASKSAAAGSLQQQQPQQQQANTQNGQYGHAQTGGSAGASKPAAPPPVPSQQVAVTAAAPGIATETVEVESSRKKKDAYAPEVPKDAISDFALLPSGGIAQSGKSIWRFGEHGAIAHSSDGGKTWKSQIAPVTAILTSASAPAKNICWIAGTAGTLLRTTDGGKHWQLIITPVAGELGGVAATDGTHAIIWDGPRLQTFQTSNGGKTWEKQAPK
jgi:hypothetical protein